MSVSIDFVAECKDEECGSKLVVPHLRRGHSKKRDQKKELDKLRVQYPRCPACGGEIKYYVQTISPV